MSDLEHVADEQIKHAERMASGLGSGTLLNTHKCQPPDDYVSRNLNPYTQWRCACQRYYHLNKNNNWKPGKRPKLLYIGIVFVVALLLLTGAVFLFEAVLAVVSVTLLIIAGLIGVFLFMAFLDGSL